MIFCTRNKPFPYALNSDWNSSRLTTNVLFCDPSILHKEIYIFKSKYQGDISLCILPVQLLSNLKVPRYFFFNFSGVCVFNLYFYPVSDFVHN